MPKMTNAQALAKALIARGYVEIRSTGRYRKFDGERAHAPVTRARYVLLGSSGALRVTSGSIAASASRTDTAIYATLLDEGRSGKATSEILARELALSGAAS